MEGVRASATWTTKKVLVGNEGEAFALYREYLGNTRRQDFGDANEERDGAE